MQLNSDQKIQKILDQNLYSQPNLRCGSKKKITHLCIDKQCKAPSLHCQNQQCNFCLPHHQSSCSSLQLRSFASLMKKKTQNLKHFVYQMINIENRIFKSLHKRRIQLIEQAKYGNLTQQEVDMVKSLFGGQRKLSEIKGKDIGNVIQKIKKNSQSFKFEDQLRIFDREYNQIAAKQQRLQQAALIEVADPTKHYAKIDSQIIQHDLSGFNFILERLNYPVELKLLYRASQHGFSSLEFHNKCDNIPNTLTIIKDEDSTIFAGFTPLTWEKSEQGFLKEDPRKETFYLSAISKQKQQFFSALTAIGCSTKHGPIFENLGFVLLDTSSEYIAEILTNFPQILNHKGKYEKGKQTFLIVQGKQEDTYRWVDEYQVYQVVKQ